MAGSAALLGPALATAQDGGAHAAAAPAVPAVPAASPRVAWYELGLLEDPIQESQLLHYLAATYSAQADIGEVLDTARRMTPGDRWSWAREWTRTAERIHALADRSLARGRPISAGHAYLRAANYYRAVLIHHPEPSDAGVVATGRKAVATYDRAIALLQLPARAVRIPYERTSLPGYFFRSPRARDKAPLLVFHQGRDAWPEESKYLIDGALERGYHCLIFHGPGQGMAIREQGLAFRADWEKVVSPVLDFGIQQDGVDAKRVVLMGSSMGGALAPRAAAFDSRIKVLIANPGVLSWGKSMFRQFEQYFPDAMKLLPSDPHAFDAALRQQMEAAPLYDWYMRDSMNKHGARSPSDLMARLATFDNEPIAARIRCRTLVMDGTSEFFSVGEAKRLFDALRCPKDYLLFGADDTAQLHCQEGAQAIANHRMFDWLDGHI